MIYYCFIHVIYTFISTDKERLVSLADDKPGVCKTVNKRMRTTYKTFEKLKNRCEKSIASHFDTAAHAI